ncbi:MAG: Lrp/AsnC family transcriptional regulator [Candidatus Omnitrophica bacterium]|nr:Lrp/AsnC family transcriptional regulator [Candidatus Omnitrophota bacterium]
MKEPKDMREILEILENDATVTADEIAKMLNMTPKAVKSAIKKYEKDGVILKYKTVINKELLHTEDGAEGVRALIEVKVAPERNVGFEHVAERLYHFPEVKSCYLMSGTYDILVIVEGKSLRNVAGFVSEKLSTVDHIRGTATHFILKKYKEDGDILRQPERSKRPAITL